MEWFFKVWGANSIIHAERIANALVDALISYKFKADTEEKMFRANKLFLEAQTKFLTKTEGLMDKELNK